MNGLDRALFGSFLLTLATLPLARPALFTLAGTGVQLADLFLAATYLLWTVRVLTGRTRLRPTRRLLASLAYLAGLALTVAIASPPRHPMKVLAYAPLVLWPCLSERIVDDPRRLQWAVRAHLMGGLVALAIGVAAIVAFYLDRDGWGRPFLCSYGGIPSGNYPRLCFPFRHPNMYASYLTTTVPLWLAAGTALLPRRGAVAVAALGCVVSAFTISAQLGGLAIAGATAFLAVQRLRTFPWRWVAGAVVAAAAAVAIFFAVASVVELVPRGQGHLALGSRDVRWFSGARPVIWREVAQVIASHPVAGLGYGSLFEIHDPKAWTSADLLARGQVASARPHMLEAHNVWLNVLGQTGILGLALFLWLCWELVRGAWNARHQGPPGPLAALPLTLVGIVGGCFLYGGALASIEEARHVWAMFGLVAAWLASGARHQERPHRQDLQAPVLEGADRVVR